MAKISLLLILFFVCFSSCDHIRQHVKQMSEEADTARKTSDSILKEFNAVNDSLKEIHARLDSSTKKITDSFHRNTSK